MDAAPFPETQLRLGEPRALTLAVAARRSPLTPNDAAPTAGCASLDCQRADAAAGERRFVLWDLGGDAEGRHRACRLPRALPWRPPRAGLPLPWRTMRPVLGCMASQKRQATHRACQDGPRLDLGAMKALAASNGRSTAKQPRALAKPPRKKVPAVTAKGPASAHSVGTYPHTHHANVAVQRTRREATIDCCQVMIR